MATAGAATTQETRDWRKAVINNEFVLEATFRAVTKGSHTIKVWRIDDDVLLTLLEIKPLPLSARLSTD